MDRRIPRKRNDTIRSEGSCRQRAKSKVTLSTQSLRIGQMSTKPKMFWKTRTRTRARSRTLVITICIVFLRSGRRRRQKGKL